MSPARSIPPLFRYRATEPAPIAGRRFFDPRFKALMVTVPTGHGHVSTDPAETIVTLLGSCVSVCVWDPLRRLAGLNHFLLPEPPGQRLHVPAGACWFGVHAMDALLGELARRGAERSRLQLKLFGGASLADGIDEAAGEQNRAFIERWVAESGLAVVARDLGGQQARRIHFHVATGRVRMRLLRRSRDRLLFAREFALRQQVARDRGEPES